MLRMAINNTETGMVAISPTPKVKIPINTFSAIMISHAAQKLKKTETKFLLAFRAEKAKLWNIGARFKTTSVPQKAISV